MIPGALSCLRFAHLPCTILPAPPPSIHFSRSDDFSFWVFLLRRSDRTTCFSLAEGRPQFTLSIFISAVLPLALNIMECSRGGSHVASVKCCRNTTLTRFSTRCWSVWKHDTCKDGFIWEICSFLFFGSWCVLYWVPFELQVALPLPSSFWKKRGWFLISRGRHDRLAQEKKQSLPNFK